MVSREFCRIAAGKRCYDERSLEMSKDAEASLQMLTWQIVEQIENLALRAWPQSSLVFASVVRFAGELNRMGATGRHLSMMFDQYGVKMRAVTFGGDDWEEGLARGEARTSICDMSCSITTTAQPASTAALPTWFWVGVD